MAKGFSSAESIIAYETCTIIIMLVFTVGRLWQQRRCLSRRSDRVPLGKGEFLSTIFLVLVTLLTVGQCAYSLHMLRTEIKMGFFLEEDEGAPDQWTQLQWSISKFNAVSTYVQLFLHAVSVWLLKACYVAYFHSLANILSKKCKFFLYTVSIFVFLGFVGTILLCTMWCRPMSINWIIEYSEADGIVSCRVFNSVPAFKLLTGFNITGDCLIALLSVAIIRSVGLQNRTEKIAIFLIFVLGSLSIMAAVGRLVLFIFLYEKKDWSKYTEDNVQWVQFLIRIEIILGTVAYGFAFGRLMLRKTVIYFVDLASSIGTMASGRSSKLKSFSSASGMTGDSMLEAGSPEPRLYTGSYYKDEYDRFHLDQKTLEIIPGKAPAEHPPRY